MKILWLHQYFATPKGWGAVRTYEFARRFVKAGHEVDVVCCAGYDASLKKTGSRPVEADGVRVFVSGAAYRPQMGFVRRVCSFLRFMASALAFVVFRGGRYDGVIASSGPLTLAVPALAGRWLRRLPFVFEVIDVWPDSAVAAGVLRNPLLKRMSLGLEAAAYRYASAIVTCSTGMTERVKRKLAVRGGACGVVTISNCCDLEPFVADAAQRRKTRGSLGVRDEQTVVLYTGAMGRSNAVADLVAAVKATADDERLVWWFAGEGSCADDLKAAAGEGAARCRFFGTRSKEEVIGLYLAADVNVVTFMHEPLFFENSPNKFFDGIAAGLPTVFNRTTWLEPWLNEYGCGIVCTSEPAGAEMAGQLKRLAQDRALRLRMGQGALRLATEVFSRDRLAGEYLKVVRGIARQAG